MNTTLIALALVAAAAPATAGAGGLGPMERVERHLGMMGTSLTVTVEAEERRRALLASEAAVRAVEAVESRLSTWTEGSELARLNRAPVGVPFELSTELAHELLLAQRLWRATDGAFDPGIGTLVAAWGLRTGGRVPTDEELADARIALGCGALELVDTIAVRRDARLLIEEGGFGKGVGLDAAVRVLRTQGVTRATLDLGGQLAVVGEPGEAGFTLEVADPDQRGRSVLRLTIEHGSVATSGNSERGIEVDGTRHGHLLDPRTGQPCDDFGSLTVWASDALSADALSTGLFVMGPERALDWALAHDGVEVIALVRTEAGLVANVTPGLANTTETLVPNVHRVVHPSPLRGAQR